jgi:hypothetical protein
VGLSPSSVQVNHLTNIGTSSVAPVLVGTTLCYLSKFGNELIGLQFTNAEDSFTPSRLTLLAEHVLKSPVVQLSFAQSPGSLVLAVRTDGEIATMTLIPDQDVFGWSRQILGASNAGNAVVESVCTIPSPNEDHDQTWVIVKRTINGGTKRYVEFFEDEFDDDTDIEDAYFVDCGITYDGTPTDTITGLDHLEGEYVTLIADGAYRPTNTVVSGEITLPGEASKVHVGLAYDSVLKTLNLNTDTRSGTIQGKKASIVNVVTRFHNTVGGQIGRDSSNFSYYPNRPDSTSAKVTPISEDVVISFRGNYSASPVIWIRQDQPLPMTILGIMPEVALGQRS